MNKAFEKIRERVEADVRHTFDGCINKRYVNRIVSEVAEEYNDGWIPCSERFPDNESYILLSFDNFSVPCVGRYKQDESGGAFYIGDDDETCISQELYVNAWQPLPEPFTEKKQ